jgi:hypothetical protein
VGHLALNLVAMDSLTVTSPLLVPLGDKPLTPAMVTALWVIADELDNRRVPASVKDAVWLEIPSVRLRGTVEKRNDNVWLRECLKRLTGLKISGEYRGDPWGAVMGVRLPVLLAHFPIDKRHAPHWPS